MAFLLNVDMQFDEIVLGNFTISLLPLINRAKSPVAVMNILPANWKQKCSSTSSLVQMMEFQNLKFFILFCFRKMAVVRTILLSLLAT